MAQHPNLPMVLLRTAALSELMEVNGVWEEEAAGEPWEQTLKSAEASPISSGDGLAQATKMSSDLTQSL